MKIVFLDQRDFQRSEERFDYSSIEKLGQFIIYSETSDSSLPERTHQADVVISVKKRLFAEQLNQLSSTVRLICKAGSGYDTIDIASAKARGIGICYLPGYGTSMIAQWTWSLLLALSSNLISYDRRIRKTQDWLSLSF